MLTEYTNYMLAAGLTTGTVRLRLLHLDHLRRAHPTLTAVTGSQLQAYLARKHMLAAESRKSIRGSLCKFYGWAHRAGHCHAGCGRGCDPVRVQR